MFFFEFMSFITGRNEIVEVYNLVMKSKKWVFDLECLLLQPRAYIFFIQDLPFRLGIFTKLYETSIYKSCNILPSLIVCYSFSSSLLRTIVYGCIQQLLL